MMIKDMNKFDYKQKIKFTNDNFSCTTMDTLHLLLLSFSKHKSSRVHWVFPFWHFHFSLSKLSCHSLSLDNCASPSFPEVELIFLFFLLQLCTKKGKKSWMIREIDTRVWRVNIPMGKCKRVISASLFIGT